MRTVKEYLSSTQTVEETVEKLLAMNTIEMSQDKAAGHFMNPFIDRNLNCSVVSLENFSEERMKELNYLELLSLISASWNDDKYRFMYSDSNNVVSSQENYIDYVSKLLSYLLKYTKPNRTLELFGQLSVKDIYMLGDTSRNRHSDISNEMHYRFLQSKYASHIRKYGSVGDANTPGTIEDDTTVYQFLRACYLLSHLPWQPAVNDPKMYVEEIKSAYMVAGCFIIGCFVEKYGYRCGQKVTNF